MNIWRRLVKLLTGIWSKPTPQNGKDYVYYDLEIDSESIIGIKLVDSPYKGVIYYYTFVRFHENPMKLEFDYRIHDSTVYDLSDDTSFKQHIGDVLVAILLDEAQGEVVGVSQHEKELNTLL